MTTAGSVTVDVSGRDVNLAALLTRLDAQMKATDQAGLKLAQTTAGPVTASQQRAANAAVAEAQAMARAAVAVGDNARAHQILLTALANSTGATDRAVAGLTAQIGKLQSGNTAAAQFSEGIKNGLLNIIGPAALASAAIAGVVGIITSFGQALTFKAQLDATTASITAQLKGVRDVGATFEEARAFADRFKLTQQETTAAISASIGVMRASKAPIEDILSVLARMQILSPEQSLQEAAVALKALASGDTTSLVTRFEVGRDVAGQMRQEIQGGADAVGVMSRFLTDSGIGMDALAAKTQGVSGAMKDLAIAQEDLAIAQAEWAQGPGLVVLQGQTTVLAGLTRVLTGDTQAMGQSLRDNAAAYGELIGLTNAAIVSGGTWEVVLDETAIASQNLGAAYGAQAQATTEAVAAAQALAAEMEEDALKAQIAAVQAETLTIRKAELAQQAQIAAQALIASGGAGEAAAARLASSSSLVDQLTAAYLRLASAQAAATGVATRQAAITAGVATRSAADETKLEGIRTRNQTNAATAAKNYNDLLAAQRDRVNAIGTAQQQVAQAEGDLAAARRQFGASSDEAFRAETALLRAQEKAASEGRKAHQAGGAGRRTDGEKLHNQLLADQERFADQSEAAEREHGKRLLEIDRDFQKAQLAQQKKNEISKRASEIDFLKSITSSELNATKTGRAEIERINAQFYADFAAAQAAAQAGNVEQSEKLVEQARRRADIELDYAEQIATARAAKDAAEVARLEALREKERQLLDEQQKQIIEGGDAGIAARNAALTEEERRYAEQQEKLGTATENKADRTVNAALREGKAVADVNKALLDQEATLNRMGTRGGAPAVAGGGLPPPAPGAPAAAAPGVGVDLAGLAERLQAVVDAIHTQGGNITAAQRDTTSAVRQASSRAVGA